jgi:hypothetical protein
MKTILHGAFGRHNFGDMLFPHIVDNLIKEKSSKSNLEFCDILSRDMRESGGHNVKSISDFFDYEKELNLICVGGQTGTCGFGGALRMFGVNDSHKSEINKLRNANIKNAYLINKHKFKNPKMFVCNGIGGFGDGTFNIIKNFDYNSFRDKSSHLNYEGNREALNQGTLGCHVPDSVVMLRHFFNLKIKNRLKKSNSLQNLNNLIGGNYIVVQFKPGQLGDCLDELKFQFNKIISDLNIPIVFFCAGVAHEHDSIDKYKKIFDNSLPNEMVHYYDGENIWDICNLISRAECVIGTSLHVRVVASQYARPRITINLQELNGNEAPQYRKTSCFINEWDSIKNSEMKMINLFENVKESINQNNLEFQLEHNKKLQNIFLERSIWIEKI